MTHYKSNLRDLEFNLFEVLGGDETVRPGPFAELDAETARRYPSRARPPRRARTWPPAYTDGDRNPPVFDPATHTAPLPESFKKSYRGIHGRPSSGAWTCPRSSAAPTPRASLWWALAELVLGSNGRSGCTPPARPSRTSSTRGHRAAEASGPSSSSSGAGAPRWCSPSRTPAPTWAPGRTKAVAAAGRLLAHRGRQALHHLG